MGKRGQITYIFSDLLIVNGSFLGSLILRFDGKIPEQYLHMYIRYGVYFSLLAIIVFAGFGLYRNLWQYASIYEIINLLMAVTVFTLFCWVVSLFGTYTFPRSIYVIVWFLVLIAIGGSRLLQRFRYPWRRYFLRYNGKSDNNLLIIGAGQAGSMVIKELQGHSNLGEPVAILDDNPLKEGLRIHGVPVVGTMKDLEKTVHRYRIAEILIAIPSASETDIRRILNQCKGTGCRLQRLPGIYSIIDGKVSIRQIRAVNIEDLLGRPEVNLDLGSISSYIQGQVVLITGAGGSIGSELCRQIAKFSPSKLVILDNYENALYKLELELQFAYPQLQLNTLIGSIQDSPRMETVFANNRPQVVFHAAAHKHVSLMETNPTEAIKNNIFGTINVAKAASNYNTKRFILISTDKAVNPTSVMGASKRVAEIAIKQIGKDSKTKYAAVRFGNVLGSNGSVVPIFQEQIAKGGPVTVTDPKVTRYFMTIPEAVQLVIQAGALAEGGEVFVLDMGEPLKILELAKDLIALSGFKKNEIPIIFTGLRSGEKLFEELYLNNEIIEKTRHEKIFVCRLREERLALNEELKLLQKTLKVINDASLKDLLHDIGAHPSQLAFSHEG